MTHCDFTQMLERLAELSSEQLRDLRREVDRKLATGPDQVALREPRVVEGQPTLGSIGAMRDAAEELDAIVADAMQNRRDERWRVIPGE